MLQIPRRSTFRTSRTAFIFVLFLSSLCGAQSGRSQNAHAQVNVDTRKASTPWSVDTDKYPGLTSAFSELFQKLQHDIQFPPSRSTSRLLPLLPESSILYVAVSNYGDAAGQALTIFQRELEKNPTLRDWWQGQMAENGPKIQDAIKKLHDLSEYLGDEVVIAAAPEGAEPNFLIIAEVRKPGLKKFLQDTIKEQSAKSPLPLRILDVQELAAAQERHSAQQFTVLVRPDFAVAGFNLHTVR